MWVRNLHGLQILTLQYQQNYHILSYDHSIMTIGIISMKQAHISMQAGHFKAKCLQLMDEVEEKHISIVITKHGKPVAKLVPIEETPVDFFGCLEGTITIKKDIVAPLDVKWEEQE